METTKTEVGQLIRDMEQEYVYGTTTISKYVDFSMYEVINTIDAYLNSKHLTGDKDSLGREKPFFNIVLAIRNIWYRATDLDRKNIRVKARKGEDLIASYLFNIHVRNWMRDAKFGQFLNDWGLQLASYGSAVLKFVEKKGELISRVVSWNNLIVDPINFEDNPVIEVLELTPAQLRKRKEYDQDVVEALIDATDSRKTLDGQEKDQKSNYIKIFEVHGELPLSYLTDDEKDEQEYTQQMQVISYVAGEEGKTDDFVLFRGKEQQNPYMLTHLIKEQGKTLSLGAVQTASESQWMINHSMKSIKDYLDLASKIIYQTGDKGYINQNILENVEMGQILTYDAQKSPNGLTPVNNGQHNIESLKVYSDMWKGLAQEVSATPDITRGENMPSGTAYRQAAIVASEAASNFKMMIENKSLAVEDMFERFITPYILKKMDTTDEIVATLGDYGIDKIDQRYISNEAVERFNRKAVKLALEETDEVPDLGMEAQAVRQELSQLGGQRFIKPSDITTMTWKDVLKDFKANIEYEITDENTDKQATFETLSSVLQTIAGNPMILQDPNARMVFNKILEETGRVSPVEMEEAQSQPMPAMPVSGGQQVGAGMMQLNQPQ